MSSHKVELLISGDVQGVGFRYFTYQRANDIGVVGWVRNLPDGRVQVVAEGERDQLDTLIDHMKTGPRVATVNDVQVDWQEPTGKYKSFDVQ